ncbi:hypothetical protein GWK47_028226 [Chionoecetes opilio]|uniref:Uncharacterized protein n=1 Tax=Chionoecetes opilio TaxID=41210 RepID=A0A8J4Z535_CHIOP|nr:hypothetical protein GWK47_028226 [Chionoecetes opilio]
MAGALDDGQETCGGPARGPFTGGAGGLLEKPGKGIQGDLLLPLGDTAGKTSGRDKGRPLSPCQGKASVPRGLCGGPAGNIYFEIFSRAASSLGFADDFIFLPLPAT